MPAGFGQRMILDTNLAELYTTLKGVNLALQWQARVLHIVMDCVRTSADNRCLEWKSTADHKGIERDADTEAAHHPG